MNTCQPASKLLDDWQIKASNVSAFYMKVIEGLLVLRSEAPKLSMEDAVDMSYLLRDMSQKFDDARKECEKVRNLLTDITCVRWVQRCLQDGEERPIRGRIATGTPVIKTAVSVPQQDTPEYVKLMTALGCTEEMVKLDVFKVNWKRMVEYVSDLLAQGKPLPPGINPAKTFNKNDVHLRKNHA